MQIRRAVIHSSVALVLVGSPLGAAVGDTGGTSHGPYFVRNVSQTPTLASSKAKIDGFGFYVPSRAASGRAVDVVYRDAGGRLVETRDEARPLISVYTDDDADPTAGDDVWAAYSLDDGDTWQRTNLSQAAGRSSFVIDGEDYPGLVSKPALTLKGNKVLVSWTSSYCESGFPGYQQLTATDTYQVSAPQGSVDYALEGYPEVGEVPYKCVWAARGLVDKSDGAITWYQPERLTSGARYAMQMASSSAPNAGFVIAWAEDPDGLDPGNARGPGEGWTGANPHPGTDVWYSYLPMGSFDSTAVDPAADPEDPEAIAARPRPAKKFSVPVPVSDNAQLDPGGPPAVAGATRPAVSMSPYGYVNAEGKTVNGAWVAYGYEETKAPATGEVPAAVDGVESGKQVVHHAFPIASPDVFTSGDVVSDPAQSGRRVRYITQPLAQMGASRTAGLVLYRMGPDGQAGAADFIVRRFVVPAPDGNLDNPFRPDNLTSPTNVSATTALSSVADPTTGVPRVVTWDQTEANLEDPTSAFPQESARGHRGMIKGDFLALGYLWTPNWDLYLQGLDIENYYVRRSFDGGQTYTSAPAAAPYNGNGVTSCRYFNAPDTGALLTPACRPVGPGHFEPAQNLTRLDGFDETAIEPRLFGLPGSIPASEGSGALPGEPYPEDVQDVSVVWQAWGTGSPQQADGGDDGGDVSASDADIPIPGDDTGKGPRDLYYTFSQDYGDTYVRNDTIASGPSAQAEVQLRFAPDGSKMYAAWNDLGGGDEQLDVFFRRFLPDAFAGNRAPAPPPPSNDGTPPPPSGTTDVTAPVSKAVSPTYSTSTRLRVRYTAAEEVGGSGLAVVGLFVKKPGATSFTEVVRETADQVDGVFEYDAPRQGVFAFYTVATDGAGNVETAPDAADSTTTVDTVLPVIRRRMGPPPFTFDLGDQARIALRFRVSERVRLAVLVRQQGRTIRRLAASTVSQGLVTRYWNGTDAEQHRVRSGRYVVVVTGRDLAGNRAALRTPVRVTR